MNIRNLAIAAALLPVSAQPCFAFAGPEAAQAGHRESTSFDQTADADAQVDAALALAAVTGKQVIIIMGANWCHDSRALAGWFETPRFAAMLAEKYEVVYVDAGTPQTGDARNQDIIKRFGGKRQKNTPYVMRLSSHGRLLNRKDARSWRNAASRSEEEIFAYFADAAGI